MKQYQNNEGYTDYTAYKAIQNVEREENKMSEVVNIYRGDIWEIQRGNFM